MSTNITDRTFVVERAESYRAHAEEMLKCAAKARTEGEQLEYFKLAKAWLTLAEGVGRGLEPEEQCEEPEDT